MATMTMNTPTLGHLPLCIDELLQAVDLLEDALYGDGFPNLNSPPVTDTSVGDNVRAAAIWAKGVQREYGDGARQRRYKGKGILPLFSAGSAFDPDDGDLVALLGELPSEHSAPDRLGRDLRFFERAFSRARESILGQARSLIDPRERDIEFTLDNWDEIRRRLADGYGRIVKRVLGLTTWIRGKIQELEVAVVPCIKKVGSGSYNRVKVEVSQAGFTRTLELPLAQADILRGLAKEGKITVSRKTKKDLLDSIRELRPWIENCPRDPESDMANQATYGVSPEVQKMLWLEE